MLYFDAVLMQKRFIILTLFFSVFSIGSFVTDNEKKTHGTLTPMRTCFDVTHYGISVKVDPKTQTISGKNIISFRVISAFKILQLDLVKEMQIDSILFLGKPLQYTRKENIVLVNFTSQLPKNAFQQIMVYFSGKPHVAELPPWKGGFVWAKDPENNDWVGLACEGIGAYVWLPCKDHWSDEADSMDMFLTVPEGLTGVSNGRLIAQFDAGEGFRTFHWHVSNPINNYNISINIGKYAEIKDVYYGIKALSLTYYVLQDNKEKAEKHFKQVPKMLKAFEHYFGAYPFYEDGYKLVETPYWGMEHQSCIAYGNQYINNDFDFDFIIIHESGHEWFANSITASDPADMWIHESFTTYSEALFVEYNYGKQKAIEYLQTQRGKVVGKHPMVGPRNEFYHGFTDNDIYYKGSWMLHTMRNSLNNDSLWFATIKNLCLQFRHKIVRTEDILTYFNTATGQNWDQFFKQYLYCSSIPKLDFKITYAPNGKQLVNYKWTKCVKGFNMLVKVYTNAAKTEYLWVKPSQKYQIVEINAPGVFMIATELFLVE